MCVCFERVIMYDWKIVLENGIERDLRRVWGVVSVLIRRQIKSVCSIAYFRRCICCNIFGDVTSRKGLEFWYARLSSADGFSWKKLDQVFSCFH